ncbi:hypothetical protein IFM89_032671 [Coptis chinensis]|uniref:Uncharacterized protein n=1 Tax=Coptis chinensis TaxID=261450 RepID=A0A835IFP5_9MAGN|nr:hypothetical protein IFM89_032671 [Coptis chinensis]
MSTDLNAQSPRNSKGQAIIRAIVAWDVAALMEYKGFSAFVKLQLMLREECVPKGNVGLVVVVQAATEKSPCLSTLWAWRMDTRTSK